MAGRVPAIYAVAAATGGRCFVSTHLRGFAGARQRARRAPAWMAGTSPAMTAPVAHKHGLAQVTGVCLTINDMPTTLALPPETPLLMALRNDCGLNGPKYGCGLGECGACAVLVDGRVARACVLQLADVEGRAVTTLEGLARDGLHPVQAAFVESAGAQCGYCLNGMIVTTVALLSANPAPSDDEVKQALRFNLCRCGAHVEILAAVRLAAQRLRA